MEEHTTWKRGHSKKGQMEARKLRVNKGVGRQLTTFSK